MKAPPFHLSVHIGDYLKKTPPFGPETWAHHGIYCSLRFLAWNTPMCRLPTDELWIARKLGVTTEIFNKFIRPVLHQQFKPRRNWWYDDDLSTSYKAAVKFSLRQSVRAKGQKTNGSDSSHGKAITLLPSKKEQQHRKIDSDVGKKKPTNRWRSKIRTEGDA